MQVQAQTRKKQGDWNSPMMIGAGVFYAGLLVLFGWQTWQFLSWLFPNDQLLMKCLALLSFDVLAAFWAILHTFYHFASRTAKKWVVFAWVITFIASLAASVLYLVLQSYFRFDVVASPIWADIGYTITIFVLTFNILALMFFIIYEYQTRHPHQDEFHLYEEEAEKVSVPGEKVSVVPSPEIDYDRIITGVTAALTGPNTDPLVQRSLPQTARKQTAKN